MFVQVSNSDESSDDDGEMRVYFLCEIHIKVIFFNVPWWNRYRSKEIFSGQSNVTLKVQFFQWARVPEVSKSERWTYQWYFYFLNVINNVFDVDFFLDQCNLLIRETPDIDLAGCQISGFLRNSVSSYPAGATRPDSRLSKWHYIFIRPKDILRCGNTWLLSAEKHHIVVSRVHYDYK